MKIQLLGDTGNAVATYTDCTDLVFVPNAKIAFNDRAGRHITTNLRYIIEETLQ